MKKDFNRSDAYKTLLSLFQQVQSNAAVLSLAYINDTDYVFTILGTDRKIVLKILPQTGLKQGDLVYVNSAGDWVVLEPGDIGAPLTAMGEDADPKYNDEIYLKPKASSSGAEGTLFFASGDKKVYVGVDE